MFYLNTNVCDVQNINKLRNNDKHENDQFNHTVYMSNTAGVLSEAGTAYHSRAPEFIRGF